MQVSIQRRRKYFIDPTIQGAILRQAVGYWLYCTVIYALVVFIFRIAPHWLSGEGVGFRLIWYHLAPMVISSAVFFPIVMFSAVRFSHRFVGPMVRFRQVMRQLSQGETAPEIKLRRDDYWTDVAKEINQVSARFNALTAPTPDSRETVVER